MKRVLIVEDHADIRKLIRLTLELEDCEVLEAPNGLAGLDLARATRPEVVLLDVMMPGELDGLALCRRLRADPSMRDTRVIMLSARGSSADRARGAEAGADEYLVKPFSPLQLIRIIAATGEGAETRH